MASADDRSARLDEGIVSALTTLAAYAQTAEDGAARVKRPPVGRRSYQQANRGSAFHSGAPQPLTGADILGDLAAVAQLARASACHAEGRGFESLQPLLRKAPLRRGFSLRGCGLFRSPLPPGATRGPLKEPGAKLGSSTHPRPAAIRSRLDSADLSEQRRQTLIVHHSTHHRRIALASDRSGRRCGDDDVTPLLPAVTAQRPRIRRPCRAHLMG